MSGQNGGDKALIWLGSSLDDLREFPKAVQRSMGRGLRLAQGGEKAHEAKPLTGYGGAGVLELVASHMGNAYRAVYTVTFAEVVYVLHAFEKKSKRGRTTPQADIAMVNRRLQLAEQDYATRKRDA